MASYRGHLLTSSTLGVVFAGASWWQFGVDWPVAAVGGLLTALGGLLPDLDSDSGVPVREMSHLAAALAPILLLRRMASFELSFEQAFLACAAIYCFVRFVLFRMFRRVTVHRGMYHSIPAMLIAGLVVFLAWEHPSTEVRAFMAIGVMIGFLSHLVLDELCSVGFNGVAPTLNKYAGTAVKFYSPSVPANLFTYALLAGLGYLAYGDTHHPLTAQESTMAQITEPAPAKRRPVLRFRERQAPAAPNRPSNIPMSIP